MKRSFRGTGMMIDEFHELHDIESMKRADDAKAPFMKYGNTDWDIRAAYFEEVLMRSGLKLVGIEGTEYKDEDFSGWKAIEPHHLEHIAREYLVIYHWFKKRCSENKIFTPGSPEFFFLLEDVFLMGTLVERSYWRSGIDPVSGDTREGNALRGRGIIRNTRAGHAAVHGSEEEKCARWRAMADRFAELTATGLQRTIAYSDVGEEFGVSAKTVSRAVKEYTKR